MFKKVVRLIFIFSVFSIPLGYGQQAPSSKILIKNINYWTHGMEKSSTDPVDVLIEDNLIVSLKSSLTASDDTKVIDGTGKYLIPGLIDTHIHPTDITSPGELRNIEPYYLAYLISSNLERILNNGVTTIRDAGGPIFGSKKAIDQGLIFGPRIYPSGAALSQTAGHVDFGTLNNHGVNNGGHIDVLQSVIGISYIADGRDEILKGSREQLRRGATQVKICVGGAVSGVYDPIDVTEYTFDEVKAAVESAENWGTYVMAHSYSDKGVTMALNAGVKSIEHGLLIENESTMKLMKEKGAFLSIQTYAYSYTPSYFSEDQKEKLAIAQAGLDRVMNLAKKYDIMITHSTDIYGDSSEFANAPQEFVLRKKWFSNVEILDQATFNAATLLQLSGQRNPYSKGKLGVVEVGAYADLLILNQDPTKDVSLLSKPDENIEVIIKDGKIHKGN